MRYPLTVLLCALLLTVSCSKSESEEQRHKEASTPAGKVGQAAYVASKEAGKAAKVAAKESGKAAEEVSRGVSKAAHEAKEGWKEAAAKDGKQ